MTPCATIITIYKDGQRIPIDVYNRKDVKRMADTCRALPNVKKVIIK